MALLNSTTIPESKWARFRIFELDLDLSNYSQILYLDVDIIVQKDIHDVFRHDLDNKLYARREGDTSGEFFGANLFKEHGDVKKVPAFCSGVLLFKPCAEIRALFLQTSNHIKEYQKSGKRFGALVDQPFLNYNAITQNLHDIELLTDVVTNNPDINTTKQIICHFTGNTCSYESKYPRMRKFYAHIVKQSQSVACK
jgi:lipopolysaccharide biosynthesis glycosyltransferase